jgi:hypothetical protein
MQRSARLAALAILSGTLAAASGCRQPRAATVAERAKSPASAAVRREAVPTLPTYRFNDRAGSGDSVDPDGSQRLLRGPDRLLVSATGSVEVSAMRAPRDLMGGVPVPARFGGGVVFWTGDVLYRSRTYLGPLEAVAPIPTNVLGVAFGWDSVLLSSEGGYRRQYRLEHPARSALTPRGVLDTAASDDGRVIALDAAGRALASIDRGQTFRDVSAELSSIVELHGEASAAWFELEGKRAAFLLPDGTLEQRPLAESTPRKPAEPERERNRDLLGIAISDGVWVSPTHAAVARGHEIWTVDLQRQELIGGPRSVAPDGFECETLSSADGVLVACFQPREGVAIVSRATSAAPVTEKRFEGEPQVAYAKGILLVAASCNGKPKDGVACVREENGTWGEQDLSAQIAAFAPREQRFQLFIPKEGGGAAALVAHEARRGEADRWTLVGVRAGPTPLDQNLPPIVRGARVTGYSTSGFQHTYRKRVDTSWVVLHDGTLRGFAFAHSLAVTPQGNVHVDPRTFDGLARRAGRAVGRDHEGRLYQSQDFGETWLQVQPPPYDEPNVHGWNADCSEVGCYLGNWTRTGWPSEPPGAARVFEIAKALPDEPKPSRPRLECAPQSEKKRLTSWPSRRVSDLQFQETSNGSGGHSGLFGPLRVVADAQTERQMQNLRLSWLEPFGPLLAFKPSRFDSREWTRSHSGQKVEFLRRGSARPVLSAEPGHAAGILLADRPEATPFLVATNGTTRPLANWKGHEPLSGFVDSRGKIWFLSSNCEGSAAVARADTGARSIKLGPAYPVAQFNRRRGVSKMFLPPCLGFENPEAIAVGPQGELAVLRLPSGTAPATAEDPALLLSPPSEPLALAPWSTLELASSPACSTSRDGYRALIQTPESWLDAEPPGGNSAMTAIVRWSSARVCLEAVEAPNGFGPGRGHLVARFAGRNQGAALLTETGNEMHRQPVTCRLAGTTSAP